MPIAYLRGLTGSQRTPIANRHLGLALAFVAGAVNAGGFLAIGYYTSHMTGIVSAMADHLALAYYPWVIGGFAAMLCFVAGAACCALLVNWGRRNGWQSAFALPLALEAALLLVFGLLGSRLANFAWIFVPSTVVLLCFVMGLQNAIITKISHAEIRTTHVTGIVTDLGIEFGKWVYWNRGEEGARVLANRPRMLLLGGLLFMFFLGGVCGALGFKIYGYATTIPLAVILLLFALVPIGDDVVAHWKIRHRPR
ncbi:MAG: YoaK family protein [Pigmentiphaga sp.]